MIEGAPFSLYHIINTIAIIADSDKIYNYITSLVSA